MLHCFRKKLLIEFERKRCSIEIAVRVHTSCASIQPLCANLCLAYSRWMGPSELRSRAPCRRVMAAAASLAVTKSTKATGPEPPPPVKSRNREKPAQLSWLHISRLVFPLASRVYCQVSTFIRSIYKYYLNFGYFASLGLTSAISEAIKILCKLVLKLQNNFYYPLGKLKTSFFFVLDS